MDITKFRLTACSSLLSTVLVCGGADSLAESSASEAGVEGFTEPYRQIELAVGEPGVLANVDVQPGSRVEPGQIVAQLDTSVLARTLDIARQRSESVGALSAAQAELELRAKYYQQLSQLKDRGHATQREIDRASTDVKVAEARVAMAEEELALQRLECRRIEAQIERRIIRSPIRGVVSDVRCEVGESFMGNDSRILTIVQLDRLRAKFSLEPSVAVQIKAGQTVHVSLGHDTTPLPGTIESVSPVMDAKSATVEVTVRLENPQEANPSGARCWLRVSTRAAVADRTRYTSATDRIGQ
jgi:RND family efflux transporter MFP subunit